MRQLDAYARQQIGSVPPARHKVLTSHDAFGYFSAAYGITFLSSMGLSMDGETSACDGKCQKLGAVCLPVSG